MASIQLNDDIYAHLLSFVSSPSDLLAVGLANKQVMSLAEPELIYRSVRCKLGHDEVWKHLAANPALASRVHDLEIMRENPSSRELLDGREGVPEIGSNNLRSSRSVADEPTVENSERLMIQAIHNMGNLESFIWDSWVPVINQGEQVLRPAEGEEPEETRREDVWTALRDYTPLKRLKVVDLGRQEARFDNARPIFESTIFTLRNLTHLSLKIYYFPAVESEGTEEGENLQPGEPWFPPRVKMERFQDLLSRCPKIESLSLAIFDRGFYYEFEGNPFTNIGPLLAHNHFHHLTSLSLQDVTVSGDVMSSFLNAHHGLRALSASLSISEQDIPDLPFSLEASAYSLSDGALPNLESVHLPPQELRVLLRAMGRPAHLRSVGILEPEDWNAPEEPEIDENYVSSLDEVWGMPVDEDADAQGDALHGGDPQNLLTAIPNLRELEVRNINTALQLQKLVGATPLLESITFYDRFLSSDFLEDLHDESPHIQSPHIEALPLISGWTRLLSQKGMNIFWPRGYAVNSDKILSVLREVSAACPLLREVAWVDGTPARITHSTDDDPVLELVDRW